RKASLSVDDCDRLFAELASLGSFRLGLTGGEPLLRKDLLEILDAATDRGLHPCLTTNALLIDETMARELGRRDLVWLNVSLEGATARSNDRVRGLGTFTEVKRRLRLLAEHARFTLAFTITRDNAEEVEACAALAHELGAHTAVFRPLYPVGVAARIHRIGRNSDGSARLVVETLERVQLDNLLQSDPYLKVEATVAPDVNADDMQAKILAESLREHVRELAGEAGGGLIEAVSKSMSPSQLADAVGTHLPLERHAEIEVLMTFDVVERLRLVARLVNE
ncbi:MAG: LON peptidase substrate-binding domain-containing protein, partial [Myxococcales bacterium]|nr:LON peptidase substrate-binding domain-containing protein [Myxococcales bacterium]